MPQEKKRKKKRLHIVHTDNGTEESFTFRLKSILILDEGNAVTSSWESILSWMINLDINSDVVAFFCIILHL